MTLFNSFFPPDVFTFVSTRDVDFSLPKINVKLSSAQRSYIQEKSGVLIPEVFNIKQVHGKRIIDSAIRNKKEKNFSRADAVLTREKDLPLAVRTADCLSVFVFDPQGKGLALIHAGWRGSRKEITARTIGAMRKKMGSNPKNLKIALGPCIRSCCYEVSKSFKKYFPKECTQRENRYYFDLPGANKNQLLTLGVKPQNIYDPRICTFCDPRYFSYRREGPKAGRMISIMMLKK